MSKTAPGNSGRDNRTEGGRPANDSGVGYARSNDHRLTGFLAPSEGPRPASSWNSGCSSRSFARTARRSRRPSSCFARIGASLHLPLSRGTPEQVPHHVLTKACILGCRPKLMTKRISSPALINPAAHNSAEPRKAILGAAATTKRFRHLFLEIRVVVAVVGF
jgi:hypothetical protein